MIVKGDPECISILWARNASVSEFFVGNLNNQWNTDWLVERSTEACVVKFHKFQEACLLCVVYWSEGNGIAWLRKLGAVMKLKLSIELTESSCHEMCIWIYICDLITIVKHCGMSSLLFFARNKSCKPKPKTWKASPSIQQNAHTFASVMDASLEFQSN